MAIPTYLLSATGCERSICTDLHCPESVKQNPDTGRWFITMGHPGFNSRANNLDGYATRARAQAAIRSLIEGPRPRNRRMFRTTYGWAGGGR